MAAQPIRSGRAPKSDKNKCRSDPVPGCQAPPSTFQPLAPPCGKRGRGRPQFGCALRAQTPRLGSAAFIGLEPSGRYLGSGRAVPLDECCRVRRTAQSARRTFSSSLSYGDSFVPKEFGPRPIGGVREVLGRPFSRAMPPRGGLVGAFPKKTEIAGRRGDKESCWRRAVSARASSRTCKALVYPDSSRLSEVPRACGRQAGRASGQTIGARPFRCRRPRGRRRPC